MFKDFEPFSSRKIIKIITWTDITTELTDEKDKYICGTNNISHHWYEIAFHHKQISWRNLSLPVGREEEPECQLGSIATAMVFS